MLIFGGLNLAALACFVVCFALFPILWLKPSKFATLYVLSTSRIPSEKVHTTTLQPRLLSHVTWRVLA